MTPEEIELVNQRALRIVGKRLNDCTWDDLAAVLTGGRPNPDAPEDEDNPYVHTDVNGDRIEVQEAEDTSTGERYVVLVTRSGEPYFYDRETAQELAQDILDAAGGAE